MRNRQHALYIVMKPIHAFYEKVLELINTGAIQLDERQHRKTCLELIDLSHKATVVDTPVSWKGGHDASTLSLLLSCVNDVNSVESALWGKTCREFIIAAFRDLSPLRDPRVMKTLRKIRDLCGYNRETILWSRKIIKRDDGSAVLVLHVSNPGQFEQTLRQALRNQILTGNSLSEGMMID